jgi:predicted DNA-binding transcriptional regulator YafY
MAKKPSPPPPASVMFGHAARLYRLLVFLGKGPQKREALVRHGGLGLRGFYRDLEALRKVSIEVELEEGRYALRGSVEGATSRLPFPDPGLTLGEAVQLAKGRTQAHRKLAARIEAFRGPAKKARKPAKKKA